MRRFLVPSLLTLGWAAEACTSPTQPGDAATDARDATDISLTDSGDTFTPPPRLDAASIPQFAQPLFVLPAMPPSSTPDAGAVEYRIAARQFRQQILPAPLPSSVVWGYGRDGDALPDVDPASTFHVPGYTIEARTGQSVRVTWINGLVDENRHALRHPFAVDTTLHWADPNGTHGAMPFLGAVPLVPHLHGGHSFDHSDGNPEAWFLPDATDLPAGLATRGPAYRAQREDGAGTAVFDYPMDQRAATLWYHDHALGLTRLNVYAGLAGFWLVRDDAESALDLPSPAPRVGDASDAAHYEIAMVLQDRRFSPDGSVQYPASRAEFDGFTGPYVPNSPVPPVWNPEVLGDVIVVNGRAWPYLEVEPRLYRFRFLDGSNARAFVLSLDRAGMQFVQIGSDGGLLPDAPVRRDAVTLGPGERADVLVDFSMLRPGDRVTLRNLGPDAPFRGPDSLHPQDPADVTTTGVVMQFRVVTRTTTGNPGSIPTSLPSIAALETSRSPRDLLLSEETSPSDPLLIVRGMLGSVDEGPRRWNETATEIVHVGDTEIWRIANLTEDTHPIHVHLASFRVLDRTRFDSRDYSEVYTAWRAGTLQRPDFEGYTSGAPLAPEPGEGGWKDTVLVPPRQLTRFIVRFDRAGSYVWHCHVLEHEDNEMMRPLVVLE